MKYSININQYAAYKMGLGLDIIDLAILDVVTSMMLSGRFTRILQGNQVYYWVRASLIAEDAPFIGITTDRGINKRIDKLIAEGLLVRCEDNEKLNRCYLAMGDRFAEYVSANETTDPRTTVLPTLEQPFYPPWNERSTDYNTNDYNTNTSIKENKIKEKKSKKQEYAKEVSLTDAEYQKLEQEYGSEDTKGIILWFSDYKADKGYKNKSDYMAIKRWVAEAYFKNKQRNKPTGLIDSYKDMFRQLSDKYGGADDL